MQQAYMSLGLDFPYFLRHFAPRMSQFFSGHFWNRGQLQKLKLKERRARKQRSFETSFFR